MNRRYFLMGAAAAPVARVAGQKSPNDTIRVAVVGLRGMGREHLSEYLAMKNVEVAAVCDIDESILDRSIKRYFTDRGVRTPDRYTSFRKVLDDKSIDAVSLATPDHHHTLQTVWGCQAGKDVYVEKPCSHTIFESRQIVAAARKYDRLVQHGTNTRANGAAKEAIAKLKEGVIGDVYMARGICFRIRDTIGTAAVEPVPAGVHYDEWIGPARKHPFTKNRFHYNWHWFWEYGSGDLGNQGLHQIDVCRWGLGVTTPVKVSAIGGHFMFKDDQETPNTVVASYEFDRGGGKKQMLVFEVRHWLSPHEAGIGQQPQDPENVSVGAIFYGTDGYLTVDHRGRYRTYLGKKQEPGPLVARGGSNFKNFIDALRSRKRELLDAEIQEGATTSTLVHLGNISYRVGRTLHVDPATGDVIGDEEANRLFRSAYRSPYVVPDKV